MEEPTSQEEETKTRKGKVHEIFERTASFILSIVVLALFVMWHNKPSRPTFHPTTPAISAASLASLSESTSLPDPASDKVSEFVVGKQSYSGKITFNASGKNWKLLMIFPYSAEYESKQVLPEENTNFYSVRLARTFEKPQISEKGKVPEEARSMGKILTTLGENSEMKILRRSGYMLIELKNRTIYGCYDSKSHECNFDDQKMSVAPSKVNKGCIENFESTEYSKTLYTDCGMKKIPHVVMETSGALKEEALTMSYSIKNQVVKYH